MAAGKQRSDVDQDYGHCDQTDGQLVPERHPLPVKSGANNRDQKDRPGPENRKRHGGGNSLEGLNEEKRGKEIRDADSTAQENITGSYRFASKHSSKETPDTGGTESCYQEIGLEINDGIFLEHFVGKLGQPPK